MLEGDTLVECEGDLYGQWRPSGATVHRDNCEPLAPCAPSKIIALWNNFHALAARIGKQVPQHPLFLIKPGSSVAGPGDRIERPFGYTGKIAYEGELGIVIKTRCSNVSERDAADHVLGYTCVNDVTAVDLLNEDDNFAQWCRSKGCDTFGCLGPVIATNFDWFNAHVIVRLNDVERQNYPLSDMIFSPAELVSRISHDLSLFPGDVIACGTSLGVGSIKDGSTVEVSIGGIGSLINRH